MRPFHHCDTHVNGGHNLALLNQQCDIQKTIWRGKVVLRNHKGDKEGARIVREKFSYTYLYTNRRDY